MNGGRRDEKLEKNWRIYIEIICDFRLLAISLIIFNFHQREEIFSRARKKKYQGLFKE